MHNCYSMWNGEAWHSLLFSCGFFFRLLDIYLGHLLRLHFSGLLLFAIWLFFKSDLKYCYGIMLQRKDPYQFKLWPIKCRQPNEFRQIGWFLQSQCDFVAQIMKHLLFCANFSPFWSVYIYMLFDINGCGETKVSMQSETKS